MEQEAKDKAFTIIAKYETFQPKPYFSTQAERKRGLLTIGYGFTTISGRAVLLTDILTNTQAHAMLLNDIESLMNKICSLVTVPITSNQLAALCSLVFNIGLQAFKTSTLLRVLNQGDYKQAGTDFTSWEYQDKVKLSGLIKRREEEQKLFLTP